MAILWFSGVESASLLEFPGFGGTVNCTVESTTINTGAYSLKCTQNCTCGTTAGFNSATLYSRFYFRYSAANSNQYVWIGNPGSGSSSMFLIFSTAQSNKLTFRWGTSINTTSDIAVGTTALNVNTWYLIECKMVISTSVGGMELKVNGNTEFTSFGTNTGSSNFDNIQIGPAANVSTSTYYYDDMIVGNSAYIGDGHCIARQGTTGTPTYNTWTKTGGGGTAATNWSETPFNAAVNCNSATASAAQTMLTATFASTQSGHGSETLSTQVVNAAKVSIIAKSGTASRSLSIRRRLASTDTDTSKNLTTSDAYYDDGIWSDTLTNINSSEVGVIHGSQTDTQTVEDVWLQLDYSSVNNIFSNSTALSGTSAIVLSGTFDSATSALALSGTSALSDSGLLAITGTLTLSGTSGLSDSNLIGSGDLVSLSVASGLTESSLMDMINNIALSGTSSITEIGTLNSQTSLVTLGGTADLTLGGGNQVSVSIILPVEARMLQDFIQSLEDILTLTVQAGIRFSYPQHISIMKTEVKELTNPTEELV